MVTWGNQVSGGDSREVQTELKDVRHISATSAAFAALRQDGRVVTWGTAAWGGDSAHVQQELVEIQQTFG